MHILLVLAGSCDDIWKKFDRGILLALAAFCRRKCRTIVSAERKGLLRQDMIFLDRTPSNSWTVWAKTLLNLECRIYHAANTSRKGIVGYFHRNWMCSHTKFCLLNWFPTWVFQNKGIKMPKFYCDYCDTYLTHNTPRFVIKLFYFISQSHGTHGPTSQITNE